MNLRYLLLYIPYVLSGLFGGTPILQYFIAWLGSLYIFYFVWSGKIKKLPQDMNFSEQFMRPFIFIQGIYITYTCVTSIFFFLNANGYYYIWYDYERLADWSLIERTVTCQRYYVLGHAAFAHGVLINVHLYEKIRRKWKVELNARLLMLMVIYVNLVTIIVRFVPQLNALATYLATLALLASLLFFVLSVKENKFILISTILLSLNLLIGITSGMKEATLVIIIFSSGTLYGIYGWRVIAVFLPIGVFWIALVPTITYQLRELVWTGDFELQEGFSEIIDRIQEGKIDIYEINWGFLAGRTSEIGMFTDYIDYVPDRRAFYGTEIIETSIIMLIPRAIWIDKPIVEDVAMIRVEAAGIVEPGEGTSAKAHFIVDAYLSFGWVGVLVFFFFFGYLATNVSLFAEKLFDGYQLGTILIFNTFMRVMWTGNCFEFFANSVLWGIALIIITHYAFIFLRILKPYRD